MRRFFGISASIVAIAGAWFCVTGAIVLPTPAGKATFGFAALCFAAVGVGCFRWGVQRRSPLLASTPIYTAPLLAPAKGLVDPGASDRAGRKAFEGGGTILVDNIKCRVSIRYVDSDGIQTERSVRVIRIRGSYVLGAYEPETFFGFCELRGEDRFFLFGRVQTAFDPETGEVISDIERYIAGRGEQKVSRIEFSKLTPEEAADEARIEEWLRTHGSRGTRRPLPPPPVVVEARDPSGAAGRFAFSIETIEQYGGHPYVLAGLGRKIEKGARRKAMEFTLNGFHSPGWEVVSLIPEGDVEPVPDIAAWLGLQGRKTRR